MSDVKKLKKAVTVAICTTHSMNGLEPIEVEEEVTGSLYQLDEEAYILAFDTLSEGKKVTTTLKFSANRHSNPVLSIVKIGEVHSRQTFSVGEWFASQYFIAGQSLVFRNFTKKLDVALNRDGGVIDLLYELWSGDTHMGYYNLEVFIQ